MDALLYALLVFCIVTAACSLIGVIQYVTEKFAPPKRRPMATPVDDPRSSIARFRRIHTN